VRLEPREKLDARELFQAVVHIPDDSSPELFADPRELRPMLRPRL
jgi:hypothetical protein